MIQSLIVVLEPPKLEEKRVYRIKELLLRFACKTLSDYFVGIYSTWPLNKTKKLRH